MSKPTFYLLCGLPFAGKTTWLLSILSDNVNLKVFSKDRIYYELFGADYKITGGNENKVEKILFLRMNEELSKGKSVILDDRSLTRRTRKHYLSKIKHQCQKIVINVNISEQDCYIRNRDINNPKRKIQRKEFVQLLHKYQKPQYHEGYDLIFDVNGLNIKQIILREKGVHNYGKE